MKKIALFTAIIIVLSCQAVPAVNTALDKIENSIYGFTYPNESDMTRLNRIEEKVYGKSSTGQTQTRIAKLKKDLSVNEMGQEITPKEDTFREDEDSIVYEKEPAEATTIDYPVINELEQQVFKKDFKGQNIKTRLSNLEKKTFNKSYDNEDLSTRVDRLKAQIKPQSFMANGMQQQENSFYDDPVSKFAQNYHLDQYGSPFDYDAYNQQNSFGSYDDFYDDDNFSSYTGSSNSYNRPVKNMSISTIEKKLFHQKFENESTSSRLTRIESSVFGTSFPSDNENERISRISSALSAQKSAKRYDSNRFGQNMATAFQIGTLILMVLACIL
ncbi:hypothetical protein IJ579_08020 [bacterium]|nr:hypothetical protein [bacterium]